MLNFQLILFLLSLGVCLLRTVPRRHRSVEQAGTRTVQSSNGAHNSSGESPHLGDSAGESTVKGVPGGSSARTGADHAKVSRSYAATDQRDQNQFYGDRGRATDGNHSEAGAQNPGDGGRDATGKRDGPGGVQCEARVPNAVGDGEQGAAGVARDIAAARVRATSLRRQVHTDGGGHAGADWLVTRVSPSFAVRRVFNLPSTV